MADRALEILSLNDPRRFGLDPDVLRVGDRVLEVAGEAAKDPLDFHFHASSENALTIIVQRGDEPERTVTLPPEAVAGLNIHFQAMDFRRCRCKCPFCFVDQMPSGMRESLYVKDEDFRLSFLYGNFTTMNDVTDEELDKMIRQRNSPQWVSVHVVDEAMRRFIFGRPMKRRITETLLRLADGGIRVHTQAVIVPGRNDGDYLRETIETLEGLHENIVSMGVVPVGLTRHRSGLPGIRSYRDEEMAEVLDLIEPYRERFLAGPRGSRFVFPSDEWFVGAARDVTDADAYEGSPQLDNGIGSIRDFLETIEADIDADGVPSDLSCVRIVTGSLGVRVFERHIFPLLARRGVSSMPALVPVTNEFFGASVTCSGLLVGEDIARTAAEYYARTGGEENAVTFVPPNCLNYNDVTIDEWSVDDLGRKIGTPVVNPGDAFVQALNRWGGGGS